MKKTYQSPLLEVIIELQTDTIMASVYGEDNVGLLPDGQWGGEQI